MKKYRFTPISAAITLALSTSAVMAQESTQKPTKQYILDTITIIATQGRYSGDNSFSTSYQHS